MPITVNGPNGIVVNFPDGTDADTIHSSMSQATGQTSENNLQPSPMSDVAASGGIGVVKGTIGLAGLPGDASSLLNKGIDYGLNKLGIDTPASYPNPTGSASIQRGVESVTGPLYEPKTTAGKYAQTVGEFAPAVLAGPGGVARKLITQAAIPGIASEAAGQATEGTAAEPYARFGAALLGGAGGNALANSMLKEAPIAAPTLEQIHAHGKTELNHPEVTSLKIDPNSLSDIKNVVTHDLNSGDMNNGIRPTAPTQAPLVYKTLNDLETPLSQNRPATFNDIQRTKSLLGPLGQEVDATGRPTPQAWAAQRARHLIDQNFQALPQSSVLSGNIDNALPHIQTGNKDFVQFYKANQLANILENSDIKANTANSGMNAGNTIMQNLKPLLLNGGAKAENYTPEEFSALEKVIGRNNNAQTLRRWGNRIAGIPGQAIGMTAGLGVGTMVGHPYIGAASGSWVARSVGDKLKLAAGAGREKYAQQLSELLRSNSHAAQTMASSTPPKINDIRRIAALLAAQQKLLPAPIGGGVTPAAASENQ